MVDVKYEYDNDPKYGWVSINQNDSKEITIVVHSEEHGSLGYKFTDGEMLPICICSAYCPSECSCPNVSYEDYY